MIALSSAVLHGVLINQAASPVAAALLGSMIGGCLYCARHLWVQGTLRIWALVALMNVAMVTVHFLPSAHHHGGGLSPTIGFTRPSMMTLATTLAGAEAVIATAVVCYRAYSELTRNLTSSTMFTRGVRRR